MRTRFLTPNYFSTTATAAAAGETLAFLRLPLSPLSHKPLASSDELLRRCCNDFSAVDVSLDLENLPISDALSKFYSDVLPNTIDAFYDGDFPVASNPSDGEFRFSEKEAELWSDEKEVQDNLALDCETPEHQSVKERNMDAACDKNDNTAMIIQFEIPELNQYPEYVCMSKEGEVQFLPELQDCDFNLEMFNIVPTDPYSYDNEDYVNPVEAFIAKNDITLEFQMPDEVYCSPKNMHPNDYTFHLLEVEEIGPGDISYLCLEDNWVSLFGTIEELHSVHSVDLELCCQDLLVSVEIDILELIHDSHSSKMTLENWVTSLKLASDIDHLQVIETPYSEKSTGLVDAPGTPFVVPLFFEELQMLDSVSFDIFEVIAICQPNEVTDLCSMLHGVMPLKSFDELIVSSELAVIDSSFTSLSVPDLADDEKIMSFHVIVDNILAELEPMPLSMSDEIYLDWHLLGRDNSNDDANAAFEKVFKDLSDYTMGSDLKFDDGNKVVLDFLLSDAPSDEMNTTEDKVTLPSGVNCSAKHDNKAASRILPDDDCQIIECNGNLTNAYSEKFESGEFDDDDCQIIENGGKCDGGLQKLVSSTASMPQFNDLDFFLNPKKATGGMKIISKVKSLDAKSMLSRGPHKNATTPLGSMQKQQKLEEVLNFPPIDENCSKKFSEAPGDSDTSCRPISCHMAQGSKKVHSCDLSLSNIIVIINTQNFDKEMIISQRSTYQKILALEKRGIQVVERDLIMPVDIILDFTTCIVWYDCNNIEKKATARDESTSSISLCMENIAANVLTSLSFAFTTCILIFEGESNFLGPVMESADELYAAAAGLGTNLQIFCSYSIELSDEIILNYIGRLRNPNEGLLSRLPESETLAESFLTKFPSINPLSAQAIASSGCMLLEFFELTAEARVHVLRKYHIPDESVDLFSALCKYGEREESKSGVTDCSSSISSPPDSGKFVRKINSEDRKRKFISSSLDDTSDFRCAMRCNIYEDVELNNQGMSRPSVAKVPKSPRISLQKKLPDFVVDNKLFCEGDADTTKNLDPSKAWRATSNPGSAKISQKEDDFVRSTFLVNDGYSSQQKLDREISFRWEESVMDRIQDMGEDCVGKVLDCSDNFLFDEEFMFNEKSVKSSPIVSEAVKDYNFRHDRAARRLSFDSSGSDLNLSMAYAMGVRCGLDNDKNTRTDNNFNDLEYEWSNSSFKTQEQQEWSGRSPREKSMQNFSGQLSKGKNEPPYVETPLSKAVHSGQQQGSPWTIEFLNRIKEKRRLRQQIPPYASVPRNSNPGNVTKATKRRSTSILEYYKYQGDNTPRKKAEQKLQKQHAQPHNMRQSGLCPTWTPNDKRARRSLSFATTGTGSQTKLVWSDNISCNQDSRFSNRV